MWSAPLPLTGATFPSSLFDMGANYYGYAADITCSFPVNGKFTADQRLIYNAVLKANLAVMIAAKPGEHRMEYLPYPRPARPAHPLSPSSLSLCVIRAGVSWVDMHRRANRVMLLEMASGGLLKGDVDDMLKARTNWPCGAAAWPPHNAGLAATELLSAVAGGAGRRLPAARSGPLPGAGRARRRRLPGQGPPAAQRGRRQQAAHGARAPRRNGAHHRAGLLLRRPREYGYGPTGCDASVSLVCLTSHRPDPPRYAPPRPTPPGLGQTLQ